MNHKPHLYYRTLSTSNKAFNVFTLILLFFSSFLFLNQNAQAQQIVCPLVEQITDEPQGASGDGDPSINGDGTLIAFESSSNINGGNPEFNEEIFLYDTTTSTFMQITNEPGGVSSFRPSISADGTRIVFETTANINGGNPEGNVEIYLFNTSTSTFMPITNETAGTSIEAKISANGNRIAFRSNANINGTNPGGDFLVYLYDINLDTFTPIAISFPGMPISINANGNFVAFSSTENINGTNPDGNSEIYLFDSSTSIITQITNTTGAGNGSPSINSDGTRIAFHSAANINGGNPEGNLEIYFFNTITSTFTQITDETTGFSSDPSINADGTRIAFDSNANINGTNPDDNQTFIYLFDTITNTFSQITIGPSDSEIDGRPSINADGTRITFASTPPDENTEVFLATCINPSATRNVPTLSEWGLIAMAGILGIVGLMVIRRRKIIKV